MIIQELILYSHNLDDQFSFYKDILGLNPVRESNRIWVQVGQTKLTFEQSDIKHQYHYCFLVPSNKFTEAKHWIQYKLDLIPIEAGRYVQRFEDWNADSIYFYDGNGNLAEFIARYDLENDIERSFDQTEIINVNEIGMCISDIEQINNSLEEALGSLFYKGDRVRFGTHGNKEGLFLLVNNNEKKEWFPTTLKTKSYPFVATVKTDNGKFKVRFENDDIQIKSSKC